MIKENAGETGGISDQSLTNSLMKMLSSALSEFTLAGFSERKQKLLYDYP